MGWGGGLSVEEVFNKRDVFGKIWGELDVSVGKLLNEWQKRVVFSGLRDKLIGFISVDKKKLF